MSSKGEVRVQLLGVKQACERKLAEVEIALRMLDELE
jgi:hypothetical protein